MSQAAAEGKIWRQEQNIRTQASAMFEGPWAVPFLQSGRSKSEFHLFKDYSRTGPAMSCLVFKAFCRVPEPASEILLSKNVPNSWFGHSCSASAVSLIGLFIFEVQWWPSSPASTPLLTSNWDSGLYLVSGTKRRSLFSLCQSAHMGMWV